MNRNTAISTKGPGDFEPDYSEEEAYQEWYDRLLDEKKLEYMEAWLMASSTATGTIIRADESYCTIHYDHEDQFNMWLYEQWKAQEWLRR